MFAKTDDEIQVGVRDMRQSVDVRGRIRALEEAAATGKLICQAHPVGVGRSRKNNGVEALMTGLIVQRETERDPECGPPRVNEML